MSEYINPKLINPEDLFYGDLSSREEENEERWEKYYEATYKWTEKNGNIPTREIVFINLKIGRWVHRQVELFKKNKLNDYKIEKLKEIKGWCWSKNKKIFYDNCKNYVEYILENNSYPSSCSNDTKERKIAYWALDQKTRFNKNKLSQEKIDYLNGLYGWYWNREDYILSLLEEFCYTYKKTPVQGEIYKHIKLGDWCSTKRKDFEKRLLSIDLIKKLEKIPYWKWDKRKDSFNKNFNMLKEWICLHDREPIYSSKEKYEKDLASWCCHQKTKYKNNKLKQSEVEKFESLNIWTWSKCEDKFKDNFNLLIKFVLCNDRLPKQREDYFGVKIGNWVSVQRRRRKNGKLLKKRQELLESVPGWKWQ